MSTVLKPFGLKPAYHPSGLDRAIPFAGQQADGTTKTYTLASGAFYQYTPLGLGTAGLLTVAATAGTGGATASQVFGSFDGVEYTNTDGRRSVAKYITAATAAAVTEITFWIFQDPSLVYEIQATGSIDANSIGLQYNFSPTAGYLTTSGTAIGVGGAGFSTTALNPTAVAASAQGQLRVYGLGRDTAVPAGSAVNAWNDTYTIVQVQIANNSFTANKTAP